ncbi:MAG: 30S ribosomal protein S8 [Rickettsiales bacterium]|nr:30S ribosomal protein S8 [Rickettsiales bacterium]
MDVIADMLTRIRNAQSAKLGAVNVPYSKFKEEILKVLLEEGYIRSYKINGDVVSKKHLAVSLKYLRDGKPVIQEIHKISKPGRRTYSAMEDFKGYYNGLGIVILSTSKGVMTEAKAKISSVGGEVICKVF